MSIARASLSEKSDRGVKFHKILIAAVGRAWPDVGTAQNRCQVGGKRNAHFWAEIITDTILIRFLTNAQFYQLGFTHSPRSPPVVSSSLHAADSTPIPLGLARTAGAAGFLTLSHCLERPERYVEPSKLESRRVPAKLVVARRFRKEIERAAASGAGQTPVREQRHQHGPRASPLAAATGRAYRRGLARDWRGLRRPHPLVICLRRD
jgi:hypothetical protein